MILRLFIATLCSFIISPSFSANKVSTPIDVNCRFVEGARFCVETDGRPLTGKLEYYSANTYTIENYRHGYQDGLTVVYKNNRLASRTYYKYGQKDGIERVFHENRTVRRMSEYKDGKLHGKVDIYDEDGKLRGRLTYRNGVLTKGYCKSPKGKKYNINRLGKDDFIDCGVK